MFNCFAVICLCSLTLSHILCAALRMHYPGVPEKLLEISLEIVAELDKEESERSAPTSMRSSTCAICVEETRRVVMPDIVKNQQCARCVRIVAYTVGASIVELETELRFKLFSFTSGKFHLSQ